MAVRDFGQKVDVCRRIKEVLKNYEEGSLLKEMVQNADDAGASVFDVLLDLRTHGSSELALPGTAAFQGPALVTHNDAVFADSDLESIQQIGGSQKAGSRSTKTGRFGVGFCSCYHATDLPSFLSRDFLVVLDPHCAHVSDNRSEPGKMLCFLENPKTVASSRDTFEPYRVFGCSLQHSYPGTIFRLPLRTAEQAAASRISAQPFVGAPARGLLDAFLELLPELPLFLTHVHTVTVSVWEAGAAAPTLLRSLSTRDTKSGAPPQRSRVHELVAARSDLRSLTPSQSISQIDVRVSDSAASPSAARWLIVQGMGAGRALEICLDPACERYGLTPIPWAGVAARVMPTGLATEGRPYCLLPLPSATGLPVHVNGFFEVSSNRRDIWHGDDTIGGGRLRSEWNIALLQDVAAPCYVELLLYARSLLHGPAFYALWPSSKPAEPWGSLVAAMYRLVLDQPLLRCEADGGSWLSARSAIFADGGGFELPDAARELLLRRGMPLAVVPAPVQRLLAEAAEAAGRALSVASPEAVRAWLAGDRRLARESPTEGQRTRREGLELLRHCAKGLRGEGMAQLRGLRLVPLRSGGWARFGDASSPPLLLSASADDEGLLRPYPALVVDVHAEDGLASEELRLAAASGQTNVRPFSAALLVPMLPLMLPSSWHGCELVKLAATPPPEAEAGGDAAGGAVGGDAAGGAAGPPLEWLLELWALLGRQQSQVDLTGLAGWPLLPTRRGEAYALPSGGARETRMLEMSGLSDPLAEALERAGVLCVHPAANLSRRELRAYAPLPTACAVLRALQAATRARPGAAPAFAELSLAERRAVRGFLAERRPAEESELTNADLVPFLRSLPIFELHRAAPPDGEAAPAPAGECVPLQRGVHCVAPPGVPESLLAGGRFVRSGSESERRLLRFLGVEQPARSAFFRSHVFGRLADLPAEARDGAMVSVLRELHALGSEDAGFVDSLRELRFVPTAGGSLHRASELFHPKVHAAAELLGVEGAYPAGVFSAPDLLSALERLGLRGEVTRGAVVQSARSVQELSASDGEAALRRARALLRYVDTHAAALPEDGAFAARSDEAPAESVAVSDPFVGHRVSISGLIARPDLNGKVGLVVDAYGESRYTVYVDSVDTPETIALRPVNLRVLNPKADAPASDPASASRRPAYEELRQVQWLPVLAAAPIDGLPWRPHSPCVASPDNTRPASDVWLVSFCAHLLDGEVSSSFVLELFGWDKPPRPALLCAQLAEVGSTYSAEVGPDEAVLLEHCIGPIYEQLQQIVGAPEFSGVKAALSRRATIWTGPERGLLPPSQVSFDDDASLCRYLAVAPPSLSPFRTLLVALGVRESSFSADDFLKANTCFVRDYGSSAPLPEAALQECVLNLRLASARGLSPETSPVFLPDADGILRPSPELTFNDAPWMPSAGQAGTRFVHGSVEPELAERLGAQSLRQLLLLRDKFTDTFPCPSSTQIQEALAGFGHESNVLLDLLEVADVLGAKGVHFCCDRRLHPSESLLFPTLVEFQGPALCVFMPGVALTTEELCLLHQHSADRWFKLRGRTPRFGRRFASAYALGEVSGLVSGGQMFLCDPSGRYLPPGASGRAAEEADTGAPTSLPVGRVYPLVPGDLPRRFPDQFAPFSMFGFDALSGKPLDGTILRLPLRSEAQAASSKLSGEAWSATRLHGTLTEFRSRAQTTLISLETIEAVSTSEWLPDQTSPVRTLMVSLSMPQNDASQRGAVLHDSSWKKSGLSSLFNRGKKESMLVFDLLEVFRELKEEPLGEQASGEEEESARETNQRLAAHSSSFFSASSSMSFTPPVHPSAVGGTSIDHIDLAIEEGVEGGDGLGGGKGAGAGAPSLPHKLVAGTEEHRQCRWVVSEALAVEGSRALALEPQYAALGKVPHAAVAAQVACDGAPPTRREGRCFGAPLPLHSCSGLPVYVFGQFELSSPGREVLLIPDAADPRSLSAVAWNRALFACVAAAYAALLKGLPRMLGLPTSTSSPGSMYGFWPLSASVAHEELLPLLLGPLYRSLSTQPLFLAIPRDLEDGTSEPASRRQRPVLRRLEDGVVCPPAVSGELHQFVQTHFTSFDLPPSLREELLTLAPPGTRPFSPAELRAYLKRKLTDPKKREKRLAHRAWAGMHSAAFCLELLDFCIGDLQGGGAKGGFANLVGLLLLPLASGGLAYVGQASRGGEPHVVATVQQQTLLPHLRSRFVSPECTAHETLGAYFLHNDEFLRAARLQSVTLSFFAQQLQPLQMQPSATYLHTVWQTMGRSAGGAIKPTPEVVELFGSKTLLPLRSGQVVAVGELSSTLALPAPLLQLELDGAASHWAPQASQAADAEPAAARPRVDELMSTLAVPVVDPAFVCVDEAPLKDQTAAAEALAGYIAADATEPHQLAPALVDKLGARDAAHGALEWSQLSRDGSRALLGLFAEHHVREEAVAMAQDWPPADPDASTEEAREAANGSPRLVSAGRAAALKRMPLYESVQGSLVPLEPRRYLLPQRHPFFTPRTDEFLTPTAPAPVLSLLRALGVESLEDADVFEKFLLPAFGEASLERQEAMRRHLLANWQRLRQHDGVRAALSRTRFVPTAFGLLAPSELLDPRNNLLSYIFGGEDRFPAQQCSTEEWLAMLGALGMKTQVDRDAFLQCARKVEALGASTSDRPPPDVLSRAGLLATHLVDNLTTLAGAPADAAPVSSEELVDDDAAASPAEAAAEADGLSAPDFCTALRGIRFVPSHAPVASLAPHEGPPTLASLEECALHTDRHLVWTVSPLLKEEWAPPRSLWARLGLVHPPPCDRVVSHAHNLSQFTADAWPWEGQPPEEVFGALWLYISQNPSLIGPEARKRLCELPTVLCGAALVKPSRIFRSCFPFCQPLMQPLSAVSLSPPPTPEVLLGMGMGEEPQLHDFVALLREVLREYACVRLSPSERRALLGILEQATECRGFRPRADMAVPTVEGGVAPLSSSVINDAPDLLRRVRPGSLQAASPALSLEVRAALKVRRLSEAVREELSREASDLEPVELARAEELGLRIRGAGFARAAAALLASEAARRDPALQAAPQRLRPEAIVEALAPYRVVIVPRIQTRLRAVPSDEEVGVAGEGPSSAWFILPASTIFLEARPRCGTSHEELLSLAVLALLQTEPPATLAPLLSCAASDLDDALSLLRYAPPARFEAAASQCTPGTPVSAADEPLLQLKPLRPLFTAEVVAVDAPAPGSGRVYALVDGVGERGDARAAVNLRVGGGQTRAVLPLSVFSFRSLRLPLGDAVPLAEDAGGPSHEAAGGEGAPAPAAAPGSGVGPGALVAAVESVLAQANVPLGLERKEMLARNLQLQEELKMSRRELQGALREAKAASDELGELKESNTCQICLSRRVDALLVGCGHLLCRQCVATITASGNNRCPFCRRDYEQVALFYAASPDGSGM